MKNKLLTIPIPVYNMEKYLSACIKSLLIPSILEIIEILIIDDGSTDSSFDIASAYQAQYPDSIRLISKENGGYGTVINMAIDHATGKYFKILDADDSFDSTALLEFIEKLKRLDCDLIITHFIYNNLFTGENFVSLNEGEDIEYNKEYDFENFIIHKRLRNRELAMHSITYKTQILRQNNFRMSACYYSDTDYAIYPLYNVKTAVFWDLALYKYSVGREDQSVSNQGYIKHFEDHNYITRKLLDYCQNDLAGCNTFFRINAKYKAIRMMKSNLDIMYKLLYQEDKEKALQAINSFREYTINNLQNELLQIAEKCFSLYENLINSQ
ncbi:MAG: glycosyltransferase family 2 protein [Tannerellaceae bacterium]|nr:glycosyltransferase family 2 protein [Tannerellaceae bacterium]